MTHDSRGVFELLDHDADLGLAIEAADLAGVFVVAARGLTACLTDSANVRPVEMRRVEVSGSGTGELLVRWLKEWLALYNLEGFLVAETEIFELSETRVRGIGRGEILDAARHRVIREVKAVTYHEARIVWENGCWRGRVVFDV